MKLRPYFTAGILAVSVALSGGSARADVADAGAMGASSSLPPEQGEVTTTTTHWYGWQTLATDGAALLLMGATGSVDSKQLHSSLVAGGFATYAVAPPLIHLIHGRGQTAAVDVALRLGVPLVAGGVGWAIGVASIDSHKTGDLKVAIERSLTPVLYGIWGMIVGVGVAIVTDAALLANETIVVREARPPAVAWSPVVSPREGGATAGVTGQF